MNTFTLPVSPDPIIVSKLSGLASAQEHLSSKIKTLSARLESFMTPYVEGVKACGASSAPTPKASPLAEIVDGLLSETERQIRNVEEMIDRLEV